MKRLFDGFGFGKQFPRNFKICTVATLLEIF